MGDCRIRIVIAKDLVSGAENDVSISRLYTSDTTVREVVESNEELFRLYQTNASFQLWDVTLSPPRDITSWPSEEFSELQGSKSKTLHSAGWFPSGSLLVLPPNVKPSEYKAAEYIDVQYNKQEALAPMETDSKPTIKLKDEALANSKPLPSQVMESVVKRFDNEPEAQNVADAHSLRRQNQEARKLLEKERAAKLDQRIQKLEEGSNEKNKKVSDQVRLMLIKSRATGMESLKQRDRLYFECMLDTNGLLTKEYRFFSPQDTFAKIASSFPSPSEPELRNSEVIVKRDEVYLRFPVSMRVYEAIADGYLSDKLNIIVIRWHSDDESPSPSIIVSKEEEAEPMDVSDLPVTNHDSSPVGEGSIVDEPANQPTHIGIIQDDKLGKILQDLDVTLNKGKKQKTSSAASLKVRCMQIKSKAKGDAKRVPKMEDRFFLEAVTVSRTGDVKSSYCFLSKKDKIERLLQVVATPTSNLTELEFLVATENENQFTVIDDTSIEFNLAEQRQLLKGFDRIILRQK